jgi:mannan endo-1,4-beta-mannosidase
VIAIHAYGLGDLTKDALAPYVKKAQNAGKKLIMQEWGLCYYDTSNNNCPKGTALSASTRDANIKKYADNISQAGIPWMYWQIIPNGDPHDGYDYEVRKLLIDAVTGNSAPADQPSSRWALTTQTGVP